MSKLNQTLFARVSEAQPCGPDYSYDPRFDELETILKGKPEVEIGSVQTPAEPPDWRELRQKSEAFLAESKHLRVATMLCCSLLKTEGLPGFLEGLQLIKAWLEQFWPTLYPLLDPEDNNDPTQRLNILGVLTAPRGSVSGWLVIVDSLYACEAFRPKGSAPITFDQILQAKTPTAEVPDAARLIASIREVDKISVELQAWLQACLEEVKQIDQLLTTHLGSGGSISFEGLEQTLGELISALKPFLPGTAEATGTAAAESAAGSETATGGTAVGGIPGIAIQGSIRSREDVVRVLDGICNYYKQVEPGSPVPLLLRRAQKLARMDFVEAMRELNLATLETMRPSMGSILDEFAPPATETPQ